MVKYLAYGYVKHALEGYIPSADGQTPIDTRDVSEHGNLTIT